MNTAQYIIDITTQGDRSAITRVEAVQRQLDATDRTASKLSGRVGGLGSALKSLPGGSFLANPLVQLTTALGVITKLGMQAEKTTTAFNVLVGSEEKAAKMLKEINQYADNTLWDRSTTQEAAKTMLGFGVSTESVTKDLKMLGDVAMGDKNKLQQLALVFGQISAAGKLQGQDLLQLINAGYNPLLDISALTGKSVAKLKDEMSKGLVTFDMVRAAFERATGEGGKFNNMTEQIAQTTYGAWEQLKGKVLGALLEIYDVIKPVLVPVIKMLGDGIAVILKVARPAFEILSKVVSFLLPIASELIRLVEWLISGISECWDKFDGLRAVVLSTWDVLKGFANIIKDYVLARLNELVGSIGKIGETFAKLFSGDFKGAASSAKEAFGMITGRNSLKNAVRSGSDLVGNIDNIYAGRLSSEQAKQKARNQLSTPEAAGGVAGDSLMGGLDGTTGGGSGDGGKIAKDIATGGTRNTSIVINISKFFDDVNITTADSRNMRQLQDAVLESINRSLEIATSAAR